MYEESRVGEFAHYGVKGMKWGQTRTQATATQIKSARTRLKKETTRYRAQSKKLDSMTPGSAKRRAFEAKLKKRHQAYLKNPDRVIAARMTRGEKFLTLGFAPGGPPGMAVAAGLVAAASLTSRTIEYKQAKGSYNKTPTRVKEHVGLHKVRTAAILGASVGPAVLQIAGPTLSAHIAGRATANRAAAAAAPTGLGSTASKIAYAAKRGGVHKITTLK